MHVLSRDATKGKNFFHYLNINRQFLIHQKLSIFPRFPTNYQLLNHTRQIHTLERTHICQICSKGFCTSTNLNDHIQVHKKEPKFPCTVPSCTSVFSRKRSLDGHLKFHYDIRDHFCNVCPAKFRAADALKKHKKVHEGFRPFRCLLCCVSFKDIGPLKRHLTMEHKQNKKGRLMSDKKIF